MGYHVIIKHTKKGIDYRYITKIEELASLELSKSSIVYEAEEKWCPTLLSEHQTLKQFSEDWFRCSVLAEQLFFKQAVKNGYMIERINQDQDSFKMYHGISKEFLSIKRGDCIIRNVGNLEIDIKCKTVYRDKNGKPYFSFINEELDCHLEMQKHTRTPIIIAAYMKCKDRWMPDSNELYMIDVNRILRNKIEKKKRNYPTDYPGRKDVNSHRIFLSECLSSFQLIEYYKANPEKLFLKST